MAIKIRGYCHKPRIATVRRAAYQLVDSGLTYETMYIYGNTITFASDGISFSMDCHKENSEALFSDGDIVTIDARGLIRTIFSRAEGEATIFITGKCNSNCLMCPCSDFERRTSDGMPNSWLKTYIEMLPQDVEHVVVTGGEPTLNLSKFFMAMHLLASCLPRAETLLLTNGRSFCSEKLVKRLLQLCPPYLTAGIPLHGHCSDLHDEITRVPESFWQTSLGINNLHNSGIALELRVVVSRLNYLYLDEIADLILRRFPFVDSVKLMGLEVLGSCAKNFDLAYVDQGLSWKYMRSAVEKLLKGGIPVQIYNYPLCVVDQGFWPLCKKSISPYKVRFYDQCEGCDMRKQCGGFFASTLHRAKPEVYPLHFEK